MKRTIPPVATSDWYVNALHSLMRRRVAGAYPSTEAKAVRYMRTEMTTISFQEKLQSKTESGLLSS